MTRVNLTPLVQNVHFLLVDRGLMGTPFSGFNYKPQTDSHHQHLALYMDRHQCSVAIMIEVTSCRT